MRVLALRSVLIGVLFGVTFSNASLALVGDFLSAGLIVLGVL